MKLESEEKMPRFETEDRSEELRLIRQIAMSGVQEEAFFVCNQELIQRRLHEWSDSLPGVQPFFDLSCNDSPSVLRLLADMGVGFSCKTKQQIETVQSLNPDLRVLYDSGLKMASHLRAADSHGVKLYVVDNEGELQRIKKATKDPRIILRLSTTSSLDRYEELIEAAADLGLKVIGVRLDEASCKLIALGRLVFAAGKKKGFTMTFFDVGRVADATEVLNTLKSQFLDHLPLLELIGHVDESVLASAFTLATRILAKRSTKLTYIINDGVFGSFGPLLSEDKIELTPIGLTFDEERSEEAKQRAELWGPSGDELDVIGKGFELSGSLDEGDWIVFPNMGSVARGNFSVIPVLDGPGDTNPELWVFLSKFSSRSPSPTEDSYNGDFSSLRIDELLEDVFTSIGAEDETMLK